MTLIEVSISSVIVVILLLASSMAFVGNMKTAGQAQSLTGSGIFLETVMEDITAVDYANLLVLDGNQIFENNDATDSSFRVDLDVSLLEVDLVSITAVLRELPSDRQLIRLTSLRCRR